MTTVPDLRDRTVESVRARPATAAALLGLGVGGLVALAAAPHGLGVFADSISYLRAGEDLSWFTPPMSGWDEPLALWPPGYPMLLAGAALLTGFDVLYAAQLVMVASLVGLAWIVCTACQRAGCSRSAALAATAVTLLGPGVMMALDITSELPFTVLALGALLLVGDAASADRPVDGGTWGVVAAGLLAAGSVLVRTLGVAVVAAGAVTLLLEARRAGRGPGRAVGFTVVALVLPALWWARTWAVAGAPVPSVGPADRSLPANVGDLLQTVGTWVEPLAPWRALDVLVGAAAAVLIGASVVRAVRRAPAERRSWVLAMALFVVCTVVVLLVSASLVHLESIDLRLLSPVFPALVIVLAPGVERWFRLPPGSDVARSAAVRRWAAVAGLVWIAALGFRSAHSLAALGVHGAGLAGDRWADTPLVQAADDLPPAAQIASDRWDVLVVRAGSEARPIGLPCDDEVDLVVWSVPIDRAALQPQVPYLLGESRLAPEGVSVFEVEGCADEG